MRIEMEVSTNDSGVVVEGITFENRDHGLYVEGQTFPVKDAIRTAGFFWRELPGAPMERGKPAMRWTAEGTQQSRQAALARLRKALGTSTNDDKKEAFPPTPQQQAIIDGVRSGEDVVVRALAGTGKTSTLEMIARRLNTEQPGRKIVYVAFNKTVQVEAEARMPSNVESRTGDSIAFVAASDEIKKKFSRQRDAQSFAERGLRRHRDVAEYLGIDQAEPLHVESDEPPAGPQEQASAVMRTVEAFTISADDEIAKCHVPERFQGVANRLLPYARGAWKDLQSPTGKLRITNSHITKMWALSRPDFSRLGCGLRGQVQVVFFDEAQDINPVMARVIREQTVQKVYVGDSNQAIYAFRGAVDELNRVKAPHDLPLTKSWRFGPAVAEIANRFLELLDSPHRVEGAGAQSTVGSGMRMPDAVLVRSNAGAIGEILNNQQDGRIVGAPKGVKGELRRLVETARWLQQGGTPPQVVHEDLAPFRTWQEVQIAADSGDDLKIKMLERIVTDNGIPALETLVSNLVDMSDRSDRRKPDMIVSTAHKSKGLEWSRVKIGPDFRGPKRDKNSGELILPEPEELRLAYVAVTRARQELDPGSLNWVYDV